LRTRNGASANIGIVVAPGCSSLAGKSQMMIGSPAPDLSRG
jgi:hypothetical protein